MRRSAWLLVLVAVAGCRSTLPEAKKKHQTQVRTAAEDRSEPAPPPPWLELTTYPASPGNLAAYLTPDPKDGKKHPAIVWIVGGDCNSPLEGELPERPDNDQSAGAYRDAGLIMLFPSLRGGHLNPGTREDFYGEVDDVIAAADFLAKLPYVDPTRVYLGGHSSGGTMALLVAESTSRFRGVIALGPVDTVARYPASIVPVANLEDEVELKLRSPSEWLRDIASPTLIAEGREGNITSLQALRRASFNERISFTGVPGATHFTLLAPLNTLLAKRLAADTGETVNLKLTPADVRSLGFQ